MESSPQSLEKMTPTFRVALLIICCILGHGQGASADTMNQGLFSRLDANQDGLIRSDEIATDQQRLFARLLRRGDKNRDSALSTEEWEFALRPTTPEKPIEKAKSHDLPGADATRLLLLRLDADRDRRLTRDEAPKELKQVFDRLVKEFDRNSSGTLNQVELNQSGPKIARVATKIANEMKWDVPTELQRVEQLQGNAARRFDEPLNLIEAISNPKQANELFRQLDQNGDGQIARSEVTGRAAKLFDRADRNGDNVVDQKEFSFVAQRLETRLRATDGKSAKKNRPSRD